MRGVALLLAYLCCLPGRWSLKMRGVEVPAVKRRGESATLRCLYDMAGAGLYSVTWYKDGAEFYRFMPSNPKPKVAFPDVPGANVNVKESDEVHVKLVSLSVFSSGEYRCEANSEAPVFAKVSDTASMLIVAPPESDPVISGFEDGRWAAGDTLELNCTSAKSFPAAELHWSVHGRLITGDLLTPYPTEEDEAGLRTTTLGLSLHLRPTLLSKGPVKAACQARVSRNVSKSEDSSSLTEPLYTNVASIQVGSGGGGAAQPSLALLLLLLLLVSYTAAASVSPAGT